jgi:Protein of unknown function (DUF1822)
MVGQLVQIIGENGIMLNLNKMDRDDSDQLYLEVSSTNQQQAWHIAQNQSNAIARYNAYLNSVCLKTFLSWFKDWIEETNLPQPEVWPNEETLSNIWEFVNGTAIQMGETRLVLIPSDETDAETLCVPQEWIDIPSWVGDYYLAIQVNLDDDEGECSIEVRGFTTHRQLKNNGRYNESDTPDGTLRERTYSLPLEDLIENLTTLKLTLGLNLQEKVPELSAISDAEALKLLDVLADSSLYSPRLKTDIPFEKWAILLVEQKFRQQLYDRRMGRIIAKQPIQLSQWLQDIVKAGQNAVAETWQEFELLFAQPQAVRSRGNTQTNSKEAIAPIIPLLQADRPAQIRRQAAGVLGEIGRGNPDAIDALIKLLQTDEDEETRWQASLSLGKIDPNNPLGGIKKARLIDLGMQLGSTALGLIVSIIPKAEGRLGVYLQVQSIDDSIKLPPHLKLSVLSESGETIPRLETEARSDDNGQGKDRSLELRFSPPPGILFRVRVSLDDCSITEDFIA